ncbi:MAG: hypothetical protein ACI81V_001079, partial [Lentimonas sp.]
MNKRKRDINTSCNGSTLLMVLVPILAIAMVSLSMLKITDTSSRITEQHITRLKAKTSAELIVEYGAAELASRFESRTSFSLDALQPDNDPLRLPSSMTSFLANSEINQGSMVIRGGVVPPGEYKFIHPDDPLNEFDPFRGKVVFYRAVEILAKATVESRIGQDVSAYAREVFSVRDAPLFTNAIFYNSTLEINPGFDMDIEGPVHTNGDLYVAARPGANLKFYGKVTAAGGIFHDEIMPVHMGGAVSLLKSEDPVLLATIEEGGSYLDSTSDNWAEDAAKRWNGYVQDEGLGVATQNVVAFNDYVADDPSTFENERNNSGYAIIEPLLPAGHSDRKSAGIRSQKMAYQAGLLIKLEPGGQLRAYAPVREDPTSATSEPTVDLSGDVIYQPVSLPAGIIGDPNAGYTDIEQDSAGNYITQPEYYGVTETTERVLRRYRWGRYIYYYYEYVTTREVSGFYDQREDKGIDTVALDVGKLKQYIEAKDNSASGFNGTFDVDTQWNGVVYVEFPTSNTVTTDGDYTYGTSSGLNDYNIVPAADPTTGLENALVLMDAKEIPEPSGAAEEGFTIATNAPTYVIGSYNADGVPHANDSTQPDNAAEKPAAIMADTVTLLSDNWGDRNYRESSLYDGYGNIYYYRYADSYIEIAAAIVTGTPNTIPTGSNYPTTDPSRPLSLGVVNLPRFLEYWGSSRQVTIRGALISLFES